MSDQLELLDPAHPWLDSTRLLSWLQLDAASDQADIVETCRLAAAAWCEEQRQDLIVPGPDVDGDGVPDSATFTPRDTHVQAGILAAARLYARRSSPAGLASYGDFGPAEVLRLDPDVCRMLGVGRNAAPRVG